MLRLLLLRHSKAAPPVAGGDVQRPLDPRGRKDALRLGEYLRTEDLVPDIVFVSSARRTLETWEIAQRGLAARIPAEEKKNLYLAESHTLLRVVKEAPAYIRRLLVVGHNPGIATFAVELARTGDARALTSMNMKFPTSALAVIDFEGQSWVQVDFDSGRLDRFVTPASLDG